MILEIEHLWLFLSLLAIVAFLYASVGHGGASGYIALMAIFSFTTATINGNFVGLEQTNKNLSTKFLKFVTEKTIMQTILNA